MGSETGVLRDREEKGIRNSCREIEKMINFTQRGNGNMENKENRMPWSGSGHEGESQCRMLKME